jgi:glutamyl-tRNA reductase
VRNQTSGRTLSTEFTLNSPEVSKALVKLEKEHSDLLSLYSKMSDELLHLKTLEKLDKQREKQIQQIKNRLNSNTRETNEIQNNLKFCEGIFKEFVKRMEKGGLTAEEKKILARQIQNFFGELGIQIDEVDKNEACLGELWNLIPKTEKLLLRLENNLKV